MKCDLCDQPAVVHEVTVRNGVKQEKHLCEQCATAAGVALPEHKPIDELLTQFVVSTKSGRASKTSRCCPTCGLTLTDFRQSGMLGCADCYEAFGRQLTGVIERAQNGGTAHAGKTPRRGGGSIDRQIQIHRMAQDLEAAVRSEQFERAAELRDRLQKLESEWGQTDPPDETAVGQGEENGGDADQP